MRAYELFERKEPDGTYAAVRPSEETANAIVKYCEENNIPNPVPADDLHCTLLYSRKYLPNYTAADEYDEPMIGKNNEFDIWESTDSETGETSKCMVLKFDCEELSSRHNELMKKHKATYDYDEYIPHITFSYDVSDMNIAADELPPFNGVITLTTEYQNDLELNDKGDDE